MRSMVLVFFLSCVAQAGGKVTLRHRPDSSETRPVATEVIVTPDGSDLSVRLKFSAAPWGEACKSRCANVTLFVDTDNSRSTGLHLEDGQAEENGADLAITVVGTREYQDTRPEVSLKVKVRELSGSRVEDGQVISELDVRHDPERVHAEDKTVALRLEATSATLPSGKKMRVVYHPPGAAAVSGMTRGFLAQGGTKRIEILKAKRP